MLTALLSLLVTQAGVQVAVIDISESDAIYEDVSRAYAQALAEALTRQGVTAVRIDESELPEEGCRSGPCLGVAARAKGAKALVTLDATEVNKTTSRVAVVLLRATNGEPLAGGRYELRLGVKRPPAGLTDFLSAARKAATKL